jgi:ribosomal protein L11 methyltransferase
MANILAAPLIKLAPVLLCSLRPGGLLALSGILVEQADDVLRAYRADLVGVRISSREDWVLLQGQKTAAPTTGPDGLS